MHLQGKQVQDSGTPLPKPQRMAPDIYVQRLLLGTNFLCNLQIRLRRFQLLIKGTTHEST